MQITINIKPEDKQRIKAMLENGGGGLAKKNIKNEDVEEELTKMIRDQIRQWVKSSERAAKMRAAALSITDDIFEVF